jgi:hypothetical protein
MRCAVLLLDAMRDAMRVLLLAVSALTRLLLT